MQPPSTTGAAAIAAAAAAAASAAAVVVGGVWAWFRFHKDAPYMARANLTVEAQLFIHKGIDFLRVKCVATAVGKGKVQLLKSKDEPEKLPPNVAVYRMTPDMIENPQTTEWPDPCGAAEVFVRDEEVTGGELLEDVALIWLGRRQSTTVAYQATLSFRANDKKWFGKPYNWQAVTVVPVEALPVGPPEGPLGSDRGNSLDAVEEGARGDP